MACFVTGSHEGDLRLSLEEARNKAQEATRLLCQVCEDLERQGISMPTAVGAWWRRHKEQDARRREIEIAESQRAVTRQQALAKLTEEERSVLGL